MPFIRRGHALCSYLRTTLKEWTTMSSSFPVLAWIVTCPPHKCPRQSLPLSWGKIGNKALWQKAKADSRDTTSTGPSGLQDDRRAGHLAHSSLSSRLRGSNPTCNQEVDGGQQARSESTELWVHTTCLALARPWIQSLAQVARSRDGH